MSIPLALSGPYFIKRYYIAREVYYINNSQGNFVPGGCGGFFLSPYSAQQFIMDFLNE